MTISTNDLLNSIMQSLKKSSENVEFLNIMTDIKKIINDYNSDIIVSIKDIEECVEKLSNIIAEAINNSLNVPE